MLQVKKLTIVHKKDLREIVKEFSFVLNPGDKAVVTGEEGNGKSTLLKWIYDPEMIEGYANARGERICSGERLGYLPQELPEEDREKKVYEFFCEEEAFARQTPKELAWFAARLKLSSDFFYRDQKMSTLSGGEKVKAQMARLLMAQPTVLLLDEPSNDIDIETLEWLEHMILAAGQPILFISHDETLIERTANVVIHLEQLKRKTESRTTVAKMSYRKYVSDRLHQLENQERQAANERREEKRRQEKFRRLWQSVEHDLNSVSRQDPHGGYVLKKKMKAVKYEELLEPDQTPVEFLSVTGEKEEITRIRTWLGSLKYTVDEMGHPMRELSGGQKAKVLLLKMSMSGADVLILDEPTRNFSPLSGPVIRHMLREYQGAILSVSHDRKFIEEVCTTVYRLTENGLMPLF